MKTLHFWGKFSSVQPLSHIRLFATSQTAAHQDSLFITTSWSLFKLMSIKLVMPSNHFILCFPFYSPLQSFLASGSFPVSNFFLSGSQSIGASAPASVLPINEYSGLISFRIDWLDLLEIQRTLKSLLEHHSSKTSISVSNPERWCCESAALNMPANLENSAVATGLGKVRFHSSSKERQCQRMLKLPHNCTHLTR